MKNQSIELPVDLTAAQEQFTQWRAGHKSKTRYPEHLWQLAVELSRKYGHNQVYKALRLDYYSLKKRLECGSASPRIKSTPAFVEISPQPTSVRGKCTLECESSDGHHLRIHLDGDLSESRSFCVDFWRGIR